jgi:ArsR family transcriptional regulator, virulence genes transcriptional regulator
MSHVVDRDLADFETRAKEASRLLKALANEKRLMILCKLLEAGEMNVSRLGDAVGLGQSALSQHLARMREEGLVTYRRDAQSIFYRVADPNVMRLIALLKSIFC